MRQEIERMQKSNKTYVSVASKSTEASTHSGIAFQHTLNKGVVVLVVHHREFARGSGCHRRTSPFCFKKLLEKRKSEDFRFPSMRKYEARPLKSRRPKSRCLAKEPSNPLAFLRGSWEGANLVFEFDDLFAEELFLRAPVTSKFYP